MSSLSRPQTPFSEGVKARIFFSEARCFWQKETLSHLRTTVSLAFRIFRQRSYCLFMKLSATQLPRTASRRLIFRSVYCNTANGWRGDAIPAASPETSVAPRISGRRRKNGGYFGWMSYTNFLPAMDIKDQTVQSVS